MTRRLLLAAGGSAAEPPPPVDPPPGGGTPNEPTLPYAFPTSAPWNVPTYTITPTPDGTGSVLHPGVLDFGGTPWRGWRFWMAVTPMFHGIEDLENPCILVSADGYDWQPPPGLTNPLYADPPDIGGKVYNSDTDLVYDEPNDRLLVFWREVDEGLPLETIWRMQSTDGFTWTNRTIAAQKNSKIELISPAVTTFGDGAAMWVMNSGNLAIRFADTLTSPFNADTESACTWIGGQPAGAWHVGIIRHGAGWKGLLLCTNIAGYRLLPISSTNGVTWKHGPPVLLPVGGTPNWQHHEVYRASLQPHQDGLHMRVWYSGTDTPDDADTSWRVGYTRIPLTEWPT